MVGELQPFDIWSVPDMTTKIEKGVPRSQGLEYLFAFKKSNMWDASRSQSK